MSKILVIGAAPASEVLAAAEAVRETFGEPLVLVKRDQQGAIANSGLDARFFEGTLGWRNPALLRALVGLSGSGSPVRKGSIVVACGQYFNHFHLLRMLSEVLALPCLGGGLYIHYRNRLQKMRQGAYRRHPERFVPKRLRRAWSVLLGDKRWEAAEGPLQYNQMGLATKTSAAFMNDPEFQRCFSSGADSWGADVHWQVHVMLWLARQAMDLPGDFVECGVHKGGYSMAIMQHLDLHARGKRFWLLDTFYGREERYVTPAEFLDGARASEHEDFYEYVVAKFKGHPESRIIRGAVPDSLGQVEAGAVCFLSIDMNCVLPEIAAAEHFWDLLSPGAPIVLDDYGWPAFWRQKEAFDAFAAERGVSILCLPTGQGIIMKPLSGGASADSGQGM